ncbi:MAG: hypothetical protein ACR2PJ_04490 [Pseudomonadales bacterium]
MLGRREFLKLSATGAALGSLPVMAMPRTMPTSSPLAKIDLALFSAEHDALARAGDADLAGVPVLMAEGDLVHAWRNAIYPALKQKEMHVFGITPGFDAFALGEMARDYGHAIVAALPSPATVASLRLRQQAASLEPADLLDTSGQLAWLLAPSGINYLRG